MRSKLAVFFLLFVCGSLFSQTPSFAVAIGNSDEVVDSQEYRTDHRVGFGMMSGGPAGIFGIDMEVNITESLSGGFTIGTGVDYTTLGVRSRFYILAKYVNPFLGFHYMYWDSNGRIARPGDMHPKALVDNLLTPSQIQNLPHGGFNLHMVAPEIGIQYQSSDHFAFSGSFMYLSNFSELRGAPYGQVTVSWFF